MSKNIHIAIGSTCSKPGDIAGNLAQIEAFARQASADGADLILTPELSASGYGPYPEVLATAEPAGQGPIYKGLARMAGQYKVVVLAGFAEAANGKRYLAHYAVWPDGHFVVQRKNRVTINEQPFDTDMVMSYANERDEIGQPLTQPVFQSFEIANVKCAISICADGGVANLNEILAGMDVELLLGPSGAGGRREDRVTTEDLKTPAGRENYAFWLEQTFFPGKDTIKTCMRFARGLAAVNQCGFDGKRLYHIGHGTITTPMGEVAAIVHGLPNLDRQRPMYTHAIVDVENRLWPPREAVARTQAESKAYKKGLQPDCRKDMIDWI